MLLRGLRMPSPVPSDTNTTVLRPGSDSTPRSA